MNPTAQPAFPWWIFALFPLYFAFIWCAVLFILSRSWVRLSPFRAETPPAGQKLTGASARVGWVNYNRCLTIVIADAGLYIAPWLLFRLFQPPVLIPWGVFGDVREQRLLWAAAWAVTVDTPKGGKVAMVFYDSRVEEALRRHSGAVALTDAVSSMDTKR